MDCSGAARRQGQVGARAPGQPFKKHVLSRYLDQSMPKNAYILKKKL